MPGGGSRKDEKLVPSAGGVQGWVAPDRKDPPRRLRLLPLSRGDFQERRDCGIQIEAHLKE